jgi:hypothetical protein
MTISELNDLINECIDEVRLGDIPPTNLSSYLQGMSRGVSDKLFFLNQIKPDLIVDFGSANGFVLGEIHKKDPSIKLVGYDISDPMIKLSQEMYKDITFTNTWASVVPIVKQYSNSCLLLSSVIHEVYSYSDAEGVNRFWKEIFNTGFKYIVIRDTIPSVDLDKVKNFKRDVDNVKSRVDPVLLQDYEDRWGKLDSSYKNFVRFVLMYRYKENWGRERLEDYLPLTYENFLMKIDTNQYKIIYDKKFKYKPIQQSFAKDFGISLRKDTHLKMILKKK